MKRCLNETKKFSLIMALLKNIVILVPTNNTNGSFCQNKAKVGIIICNKFALLNSFQSLTDRLIGAATCYVTRLYPIYDCTPTCLPNPKKEVKQCLPIVSTSFFGFGRHTSTTINSKIVYQNF